METWNNNAIPHTFIVDALTQNICSRLNAHGSTSAKSYNIADMKYLNDIGGSLTLGIS